ncbi:MAG: hypothetical protein LBL65_05855 [Campylobacteraceae bacterium]|nr:hypothetical protein [Campylobacteraceae bacterium]
MIVWCVAAGANFILLAGLLAMSQMGFETAESSLGEKLRMHRKERRSITLL